MTYGDKATGSRILKPSEMVKMLLEQAESYARVDFPIDTFSAFYDRVAPARAPFFEEGSLEGHLRSAFAGLHWRHAGYNTITLTHSLAAALTLTDPPPAVEGADIKLPFNSFLLMLPEGVIGDQGGWVRIVEFCSYHYNSVARGVWIRTMSQNMMYRICRVDGTDWEGETRWIEENVTQKDDHAMKLAGRLLRNFAAWIDSGAAMEREGRSKNRRKNKGKKDKKPHQHPTRWIMGREVKLRPELRQMARELAVGKKVRPEGWEVRVRHVVRGHWRNQVCGPQRSLRKRIWIEPHWRGPEGSAAWAHVYKGEDRHG